jgi:hypothetical protein
VEFEESGEDAGLLPPGEVDFGGDDSGSDPGLLLPAGAVEFDDGPSPDEAEHDL